MHNPMFVNKYAGPCTITMKTRNNCDISPNSLVHLCG